MIVFIVKKEIIVRNHPWQERKDIIFRYFLRLANVFPVLYSKGREEKRGLDAMLLAVPR